jgi:D-alanyl-D-alanine carboxypeptidase (penicillin-binding protein 5/6)
MAIYFVCIASSESSPFDTGEPDISVGSIGDYPYKQEISVMLPTFADDTAVISQKTDSQSGIYSEFAALIDVTENKIIASKKGTREIYPASMTKVMTLIVVIENLKDASSMDEEITISKSTVEKMVAERASGYGFKEGEVLTVRALLHALILQSDGVAAISLAEYIAGSENAFVELMNSKAAAIGMENTTFKNCTGLHHEYQLTTCQDIGIMMSYAMKNTFCAEVLSAKSYKLPDSFRPEDTYTLYHATLASKFDALRPNVKTATVTAAKSGWIGSESGYCLVTYAVGNNGHKYVLVTAKAGTSEESIADMAYIYNTFAE